MYAFPSSSGGILTSRALCPALTTAFLKISNVPFCQNLDPAEKKEVCLKLQDCRVNFPS